MQSVFSMLYTHTATADIAPRKQDAIHRLPRRTEANDDDDMHTTRKIYIYCKGYVKICDL